jgi:hypothetical protein
MGAFSLTFFIHPTFCKKVAFLWGWIGEKVVILGLNLLMLCILGVFYFGVLQEFYYILGIFASLFMQ